MPAPSSPIPRAAATVAGRRLGGLGVAVQLPALVEQPAHVLGVASAVPAGCAPVAQHPGPQLTVDGAPAQPGEGCHLPDGQLCASVEPIFQLFSGSHSSHSRLASWVWGRWYRLLLPVRVFTQAIRTMRVTHTMQVTCNIRVNCARLAAMPHTDTGRDTVTPTDMTWRITRAHQHRLMTGVLCAAAGTVTALAAGIGVTTGWNLLLAGGVATGVCSVLLAYAARALAGRHLTALRQQAAAGREVSA